MDEADVTQKARAFVAKVDVSGIREDLTPYAVSYTHLTLPTILLV